MKKCEKEVDFIEPEGFIKTVYIPTKNVKLLGLFNELKTKKCMKDKNITLLLPEEPMKYRTREAGWAIGNKTEGYLIGIIPTSIISISRLKSTLEHELIHIDKGDCDIASNSAIPFILRKAYVCLIAEPRAYICE